MPDKIKILCTRALGAELVEEAASVGIRITELSFINTVPIQSIDVQQEIEQALLQSITVVFTSMNAVEAVRYYKEDNLPNWEIYCMGTTTRHLVASYFGEALIAGTGNDATSLAEEVIANGNTKEVWFFCGDQRRDELPGILSAEGIEVNEITVYQTLEVPHRVQEHYNGILFFSPSAVTSFFKQNKVAVDTVLFAIGSTTAQCIKEFSNNTIITGEEPGKANLVRKMMEYFT